MPATSWVRRLLLAIGFTLLHMGKDVSITTIALSTTIPAAKPSAVKLIMLVIAPMMTRQTQREVGMLIAIWLPSASKPKNSSNTMIASPPQ